MACSPCAVHTLWHMLAASCTASHTCTGGACRAPCHATGSRKRALRKRHHRCRAAAGGRPQRRRQPACRCRRRRGFHRCFRWQGAPTARVLLCCFNILLLRRCLWLRLLLL